jgi:hypothetical protein
MVECQFSNTLGEKTDRSFKTRNAPVFEETDLEYFITNKLKKLIREMEESQMKKSGWSFLAVDGLRLRINKYNPLRGSTFIPLPQKIERRNACVNIQNFDYKCFMYSILAKFVQKDAHRISKYKTLEEKYDFTCISFPTPLNEIKKFEKMNNISINVFGVEKNENIYPLKVVEKELLDHRDLLLLKDGEKSHYVYIKNFEKLVKNQITKHKEGISMCKRCFTHFDNQGGKDKLEKKEEHQRFCDQHKIARIEMPTRKPIVKFINIERSLKLPYVIYADFESLLLPHHTCQPDVSTSYTLPYQTHEPMSFAVYVKCLESLEQIETSIPKKPYLYRGHNAAEKFMSYLKNVAKEIERIYKLNKPMEALTEDQTEDFDSSNECYICNREFTEIDWKVRDHCHITGYYRGSAHNSAQNLSISRKRSTLSKN